MTRIEKNHDSKISYHLLKIGKITSHRLHRAYQKGERMLDVFLKEQIKQHQIRKYNRAKRILGKGI